MTALAQSMGRGENRPRPQRQLDEDADARDDSEEPTMQDLDQEAGIGSDDEDYQVSQARNARRANITNPPAPARAPSPVSVDPPTNQGGASVSVRSYDRPLISE